MLPIKSRQPELWAYMARVKMQLTYVMTIQHSGYPGPTCSRTCKAGYTNEEDDKCLPLSPSKGNGRVLSKPQVSCPKLCRAENWCRPDYYAKGLAQLADISLANIVFMDNTSAVSLTNATILSTDSAPYSRT